MSGINNNYRNLERHQVNAQQKSQENNSVEHEQKAKIIDGGSEKKPIVMKTVRHIYDPSTGEWEHQWVNDGKDVHEIGQRVGLKKTIGGKMSSLEFYADGTYSYVNENFERVVGNSSGTVPPPPDKQ